MPLPPLLNLADEAAYQAHYEATYVRGNLTTHHGVRVYFARSKFGHAFYESTQRNGIKDQFSQVRAERMDWIGATLTNPGSTWFQGWDRQRRLYDPVRSVTVAHGDFVVVLQFRADSGGNLRSNFVTCYDANNSIGKIRTSPAWDIHTCRTALGV